MRCAYQISLKKKIFTFSLYYYSVAFVVGAPYAHVAEAYREFLSRHGLNHSSIMFPANDERTTKTNSLKMPSKRAVTIPFDICARKPLKVHRHANRIDYILSVISSFLGTFRAPTHMLVDRKLFKRDV